MNLPALAENAQAACLGRGGRALAAALELFVGAGAVFGGLNLLVDAEGFGMEAGWLEGTPFPDYTIPGVLLLVVIGGGMLAAAALALTGSRHAGRAALVMGVALAVFLIVETLLIGYQGAQQIRLLAIAGIPAAVLIALGRRS